MKNLIPLLGLVVGLLVGELLVRWAELPRFANAAPPAAVREAARAHLKECTGWGQERLDSIRWEQLPDSEARAQVTLPFTIAIHPLWRNDEWTVAHEMLHVLIQRPGHPAIPFMTCGLFQPEEIQ